MWKKIKESWAKYIALLISAVYLFLGLWLSLGWKEYGGDGFSFRYPGSWYLKKSVFATGVPDWRGVELYPSKDTVSLKSLSFNVTRIPINELGANYFDDPKSFYAIYEDNPQFRAIDNYKFDNKQAVFASFTEPSSGEIREQYWVKTNHFRYDVSVTYKPNWVLSFNKAIIERILSSVHLEN